MEAIIQAQGTIFLLPLAIFSHPKPEIARGLKPHNARALGTVLTPTPDLQASQKAQPCRMVKPTCLTSFISWHCPCRGDAVESTGSKYPSFRHFRAAKCLGYDLRASPTFFVTTGFDCSQFSRSKNVSERACRLRPASELQKNQFCQASLGVLEYVSVLGSARKHRKIRFKTISRIAKIVLK